MNYDVIIPTTARNVSILEKSLPYIRKNLSPERILIIAKPDLEIRSEIPFQIMDENTLVDGLSYNRVREWVEQRDKYAGKRSGWYLQQFLKLAYAYICREEYYLSWDADTIPLRSISMFEQNMPVFDVKEEFHRPYFTTINRLFDGKIVKSNNYSYISEHMFFCKKYVLEMLDEIDGNCRLKGMNVYEKILNAVSDIDLLMSGFSEFETFGNYVQNRHPGDYAVRRLKSLRDGDKLYGCNPTEDELAQASEEYDLISFENRQINRSVT
jgi:hypothetical protein